MEHDAPAPSDDGPAAGAGQVPQLEIDEQTRGALIGLEEWLDGDTHVAAATPLATEWGLRAAGIDLAAAHGDARLYIDAYPFEGRIVGDLDQKTGRWLAERIAMEVEPAERLPGVRAAIRELAVAMQDDTPNVSASFVAVADGLSDETLWLELALRIAQRELRAGHGT
jgi:hypothetical protein